MVMMMRTTVVCSQCSRSNLRELCKIKQRVRSWTWIGVVFVLFLTGMIGEAVNWIVGGVVESRKR